MSFKIIGVVIAVVITLIVLAVMDLFDTVMGGYWRIAESLNIPTSVLGVSPYTLMLVILSAVASILVLAGVFIIARSIREKGR